MMILFLDFDGVLHDFPPPQDKTKLFCNLPRLETVLREYVNVEIVISSSWREGHTLSYLKTLFSPDIAPRVIDVLPVIDIEALGDIVGIRFREIERYLAGRNIPWIALDDDDGLFPNACSNLIVCDAGFTSKEETLLRNELESRGPNVGTA